MDGLAALLDGPRARGAFLLRCSFDEPWSVRLEDRAPLSVTVVTRGRMWVRPDDTDPVLLEAGDLVVRVGTDPWTIGSAPDRVAEPDAVILPGQVCRTPDGRDLADELRQGVRTWGTSPDGRTLLLVGVYLVEGEVSRRLLRALPATVVVRRAELDSPLVDLLAGEVVRDAPGQEAVLDRTLDLLLITVLRHWFDRAGSDRPAWWLGQADPVVGPALRLLQHQPEHPWTVADLAARSGVSRAAFARRFTEAVGQPPMTYLTGWRLDLAADLLLEPGATVGAVARRVGYSTPFALSAAFKRERGTSPQEWRRARLENPARPTAG
ncbi:AraC family transcriptional regulator [Nocardioides sp. SYSU D00038]|uniref:AraC family transcriptional regulator n=1 Tax=Nocardioides sp. SYSU D00038 TaxID=2812554 RepID=UPI001966F092|nr:AraC family transcriptional regulator [Nocardioides sp. SYSU D00038]